LDLVEAGSTWEEIVQLGKKIEKAGATIINTGIGWHESRIPSIGTMVPRAAFSAITAKMKKELKIPLITTNRINTPEVAEDILARGDADMVSLARPFLADPEFVLKASQGRADEINTCIGCNQACLDHVFKNKRASCLVNPLACYETELLIKPAVLKQKIAVVGAGPAGLACATTAASRGFDVTLYESASEIGGQFNLAKTIPGKEEFHETLRYYRKQLELRKVKVKLNQHVSAQELLQAGGADEVGREGQAGQGGFDHVVIATGVIPRKPKIKGIEHPKVVSYIDVLRGKVQVGKSVAIIGAGGIGFDVAEFLTSESHALSLDPQVFAKHWGIDLTVSARGGIAGVPRVKEPSPRQVYLLQRSDTKPGAGLGKTTGWIHRAQMKDKNVTLLNSLEYLKIDDEGLHIEMKGKKQTLSVDHVVICAGQEPLRELFDSLSQSSLLNSKMKIHLIGGADVAAELDAKRAIHQGTMLAAGL